MTGDFYIEDSRLESGACVLLRGFSDSALRRWVEPYFSATREPGNRIIAMLVAEKAEIAQRPCEGAICVRATPDGRSAEYHAMTIARLLFKLCAQAEGFSNVHAACALVGGRGLLVSATRNGGKTTSLCSLLAADAAAFVGNDQVMLNGDGRILGYPAAIGWRGGLDSSIDNRVLSNAEWLADDPFTVEKKAVMHFSTFASMAGASVASSANISAVVQFAKATNPSELKVDCSIADDAVYDHIRLPLETAYGRRFVGLCERCLENAGYAALHDSVRARWPIDMPLVAVSCGEQRLQNLAEKMSVVLDECL